MAGRPEAIGITTFLVLLALVALPCAQAGPAKSKASAVISDNTDTCRPNLAGADYVGGVDVSGNRITPADTEPSVDLSQVSVTPVLVPNRRGRRMEIVVEGAVPAKSAPGCGRRRR